MTKRFRVEITSVAERDIGEIWGYISEDSETAATRFVLKLEKEIGKLDRFPEKFPFIPESEVFGCRYRHLIVGNYRVIYRISQNTVFVLRILQGARDIGNIDIE